MPDSLKRWVVLVGILVLMMAAIRIGFDLFLQQEPEPSQPIDLPAQD